MKKWTAYIQVNGEDTSDYYINEFKISDEENEMILDAIKNNIPLRDIECYDKLLLKAELTIDLEDLYLDDDCKPSEEDYYVPREDVEDIPPEYEDDEEYCEALIFDEDSYQEDYDSWQASVDDYCIIAVDIDDPGDLERFKQKFIGRQLEKDITINIDETDERIVYYHVDITTTDGIITDLEIDAEAMESDGVKGGTFGECYPDFDFLADELEESLSKYKE